jgi:hypothetical protein
MRSDTAAPGRDGAVSARRRRVSRRTRGRWTARPASPHRVHRFTRTWSRRRTVSARIAPISVAGSTSSAATRHDAHQSSGVTAGLELRHDAALDLVIGGAARVLSPLATPPARPLHSCGEPPALPRRRAGLPEPREARECYGIYEEQ